MIVWFYALYATVYAIYIVVYTIQKLYIHISSNHPLFPQILNSRSIYSDNLTKHLFRMLPE